MAESGPKTYRLFEWINNHIGLVATVAIVLGLALGAIGPLVANDEDVNFSPSGELYEIEERVEDIFTP